MVKNEAFLGRTRTCYYTNSFRFFFSFSIVVDRKSRLFLFLMSPVINYWWRAGKKNWNKEFMEKPRWSISKLHFPGKQYFTEITMHNLNITNILVITYKKEFNNSYSKNYAQVTNAVEFPWAKNLSNVMVVHCENLI